MKHRRSFLLNLMGIEATIIFWLSMSDWMHYCQNIRKVFGGSHKGTQKIFRSGSPLHGAIHRKLMNASHTNTQNWVRILDNKIRRHSSNLHLNQFDFSHDTKRVLMMAHLCVASCNCHYLPSIWPVLPLAIRPHSTSWAPATMIQFFSQCITDSFESLKSRLHSVSTEHISELDS